MGYQVFYSKQPEFFDPPTRTLAELHKTHAYILTVPFHSKDETYTYMQGEIWTMLWDQASKSDYRVMLAGLSIHHASMSIDDILIDMGSGDVWQCIGCGWRKLGNVQEIPSRNARNRLIAH